MNTRRVKDEEISSRSKKKELRGKASTFPVYEENGWTEELGNLELAKDRKFEEENRGNINGCTRTSTEN